MINPNKYKLVKSFEVEAKTITDFCSVNSFLSIIPFYFSLLYCLFDKKVYIVLVASSSKDLTVYDLNVGKCVRAVPEVHSKPVHTISFH